MAQTPKSFSSNGWIFRAAMATLAGGTAAAAACSFLRKDGLALGFLLGNLLSIANFYALHFQTLKFLRPAGRASQSFWLWNILRWVVFAGVCWLLIRFSVQCLLGAMGTYLWSLLVLGWVGSRLSSAPEPPGTRDS